MLIESREKKTKERTNTKTKQSVWLNNFSILLALIIAYFISVVAQSNQKYSPLGIDEMCTQREVSKRKWCRNNFSTFQKRTKNKKKKNNENNQGTTAMR